MLYFAQLFALVFLRCDVFMFAWFPLLSRKGRESGNVFPNILQLGIKPIGIRHVIRLMSVI